ncbi:hypothetical protein [Halosimplex amylolyticum]|uniref:hypothetical protein n=1 Tax=Halosimplex amylolyticum TaxID=3396616 RepID=UPI003F566D2F
MAFTSHASTSGSVAFRSRLTLRRFVHEKRSVSDDAPLLRPPKSGPEIAVVRHRLARICGGRFDLKSAQAYGQNCLSSTGSPFAIHDILPGSVATSGEAVGCEGEVLQLSVRISFLANEHAAN